MTLGCTDSTHDEGCQYAAEPGGVSRLAVAGTAGLSLLAAGPAAAGSPTAYGLLPVLRLPSLVYRAGSS